MATNKTVTITVLPTLTGDTVASYNVYEGVSGTTLLGTMSVAEAAAGKVFAFTDGIVHSVKCQTVWTTAGASTLRSAGVELDLATSVLFEDDFAGTTIDTAKWDVNVDAGDTSFSQDDMLTITIGIAGLGTLWGARIEQVSGLDLSTDTHCLIFDIRHGSQNAVGTWACGLYEIPTSGIGSSNGVYISRTATSGRVNAVVKKADVSDAAEVIVDITDVTLFTTLKVLTDGTNISFYNWTGSAWNLLRTVVETATSTQYGFCVFAQDNAASEIPIDIDNLTISSVDVATQYPV